MSYITLSCCTCHVPWCIEESHYNRLKETAEQFFCPNGHGQRFTETTARRLERELQQLKASYETQGRILKDARLARDQLKRRLAAMNGVVTRMQNRAKKTKT